MVLQKREECGGLNAFTASEFPLESRPIRKKRSNLRKSIAAKRADPMDLLAAVAEMMLLEGRKKTSEKLIASLSNDLVKMDKQLEKEEKTVKVEQCYEEDCNECILVGNSHRQTWSGDSVISGSFSANSDVGKRRSGKAKAKDTMPSSSSIKVENSGLDRSMGKTGASSTMEDPAELERKPSSPVNSDSSVGTGTSSCRDPAPPCVRSSPTSKEDAKKLKDQHGDDDENSSGCTHSGPIGPEPFITEQAAERRNKVTMDSRIRKIARNVLKGEDLIRDVDVRFRSRKVCCKRQRTQRSSSKRKKLHDRNNPMSSVAAKAGEIAVEVEGNCIPAALDGGVKIRIKSFKIPELFIDMPENATVGSLKRTVLEMVTTMLRDELEVGLVLQGRKVRDDSRTLVQTGIREKLDSLSFSFEPTPLPLRPEFPPHESPQPLATLPALPTSDSALVSSKPETKESLPVRLDDGSNDILAKSFTEMNALVPLSPGAFESRAMFPHSGKPRRPEVGQRRIRRPFSVTEVEALVKAVESLGTGRWRDVKLLAFEGAAHRTYVDLKDKWKTLVHTAQISPQQRRGEPVPQVLLDRVLRTHAYWARHGHFKSSSSPMVSIAHYNAKQEQSALQLVYQEMTTEDSTLPPSSP